MDLPTWLTLTDAARCVGLSKRTLRRRIDAGELSAHGALVVNLPGSPRAVASGISVVLAVARHVIDQLGGGDHA